MSETCCRKESLAMAAVPYQEWCEPYEWKQALKEGTIFPCLNLEFYKAEKIERPASAETAQGRALREISEVGFAINDLTLYLDTHPQCREGLALYKELLAKRLELLADYAAQYQPLTQLSIITGTPQTSEYGWTEGPLPWEGGHI